MTFWDSCATNRGRVDLGKVLGREIKAEMVGRFHTDPKKSAMTILDKLKGMLLRFLRVRRSCVDCILPFLVVQ